MKDLDFRGKLAINLLERFIAQAPSGVSLMEEMSNQVGRSPADKFAWSKFERTKCGPKGELQEVIRNRARRARAGRP